MGAEPGCTVRTRRKLIMVIIRGRGRGTNYSNGLDLRYFHNHRKNIIIYCWSLVLVRRQAFISSIVMKQDFIRQLSSNSTLTFGGCNSARLTFFFHSFESKGKGKMVFTVGC